MIAVSAEAEVLQKKAGLVFAVASCSRLLRVHRCLVLAVARYLELLGDSNRLELAVD